MKRNEGPFLKDRARKAKNGGTGVKDREPSVFTGVPEVVKTSHGYETAATSGLCYGQA